MASAPSYKKTDTGRTHSWNKVRDLRYGAVNNTISRREAANLARRKSMGGKGG